MSVDYTTVVGVDQKHLDQLCHTWPTWRRHKPGILDHPMVIFRHNVSEAKVRCAVDHPDLKVVWWPFRTEIYAGTPGDKWTDPCRFMMLSGFVHVPAEHVETEYFLKIDTDTIATGHPDWIDAGWFENKPAIVASPWPFTKPAHQMKFLDLWAEKTGLPGEPINLEPKPGWSRLKHQRIISWCGFFRSDFNRQAAALCHGLTMPVPSQDGFLWYLSQRLGEPVVRASMKARGWLHRSTIKNVIEESARALA